MRKMFDAESKETKEADPSPRGIRVTGVPNCSSVEFLLGEL
jgi:hypothetical protein